MTDAALRPEIYREPMSQEKFGIVQKPLTIFERLYNQNWLRKLFVLVVIAVCWEAYARWLDNELLVPTFSATVRALATGIASGVILTRALPSIKVLLMGFATGVFIAAVTAMDEGVRAVVNVNCLNDRGRFTSAPTMHEFQGETMDNRLSRRAANWMPAVLHLQ